MARIIPFLVLLLISPAAYAATSHNVGGDSGWTNAGVNYDDWAKGENFTVGDSLVFTFDSTHTVDEVTQANYQTCNSRNPISSKTSSPTTVTLTDAGTRYFICPRSNHCQEGMKLAVNVVAAGGGNPPSSTPGTPSTPGTSPSTPSGNTPAKTPPPAGSGAASILGGCRSGLVVGLAVGMVALLGMRG